MDDVRRYNLFFFYIFPTKVHGGKKKRWEMFRFSHSGRRVCTLFLEIIFRLYDSIRDLTFSEPTLKKKKKFEPPFHWWFVNFPEWSYCGCSYVGKRWFIARACIENRLITFLVTPNMEKRVRVSKPTQTSEYKNEQGQTRCLHAPVVNHRILYFVEKVLKIYSTREIS